MNWQQLRAILWLRWRLTKNQFARAGQINAVLSIFMLAMLVLGAVGAGVGGVVGGVFAGWKAPPQVLLVIWDAVVFVFLVIWLSGLMVENPAFRKHRSHQTNAPAGDAAAGIRL